MNLLESWNVLNYNVKVFTIVEGSRVFTMCNDVVPIVQYNKNKELAVKEYLKSECTPKEGFKLPWQEKEYECPKQSTEKWVHLQKKHNIGQPSLDGPNDLKPEVKTSFIIQKEAAEAAAKESTKSEE